MGLLQFLIAKYTGTMQLEWSTLDKDINSIIITQPGLYWVTVIDSNQCSNKDTVEATIFCDDVTISWPDVMTPSGDGYNDVFEPIGNLEKIKANFLFSRFSIYDRWGILIFDSNENLVPNWDGKYNGSPTSSGTYYFVVKYSSAKGIPQEAKGYITLM